MKEITLEFFKDKDLIDFPWEQPNTPWMVVPRNPDMGAEGYNGKLMLDHPTKKVWIKSYDGESWTFKPLGEFFVFQFNMRNHEHILTFSHEFFYDTIADLKRNLKNKEHIKLYFTVDTHHLGCSKIH